MPTRRTCWPAQFAPQGYVAAASLARALTPEVRARAEAVTVTADGSDLRLQLQGDIEVRFGPARDLVTKLVRLQTKLAELDEGGVHVHRRGDERGHGRVTQCPLDAPECTYPAPQRARMTSYLRSNTACRSLDEHP